jgi:hypothetical protein
MIHPLPPDHPAARPGAAHHHHRHAPRAEVMTLVADLSMIDRIEAAIGTLERARPRGGFLAWLRGRG